MEYIEIKNLIFYNKEINLSFKENEVIGIFGENKNLINEFLLIVSGINKGKGDITYLNNDLFDNSLYFKNRLFFDFSKVYTKTLKKEFIHENLKNRFGLSFDEEKFKRLIKELKIRKNRLWITFFNELLRNLRGRKRSFYRGRCPALDGICGFYILSTAP